MNAKTVASKVSPGSLKKKKTLQKKRLKKRAMIVAGLGAFAYLVYFLFVPYKGPITYGVCKIFLETHVIYPQSLRYSTVDDFGDSVRIWFTRLDSFGEYRLEPIQCYFKNTTAEDKLKYGNAFFILDKVKINRQEVDQKIVDRFNPAILGIVANPPSLYLPSKLPDSLEGLQFDMDKYRKKIF